VNHTEIPSIPDHRLLRLIGRGSYGEVWLARNALGTPRAIKIVRRASFDSDRPYVREFSGIKKFEPISRSHDGLVDILQVGRNDAEGFFYYVMELADDATTVEKPAQTASSVGLTADAEGDTTAFFQLIPELYRPRTLASEIAAHGRLPVTEAAPLFLALAGAIGHLHSRGLLHRDIKPANVIFVGNAPKLADIGLVATAGESATFVGTEGFIPPEGPGTVGADLYAFGKLMYEVVTGRDRQDFPALTLDRDDPARNAAMMEINAVLLKCCDPSPLKRYRNAEELQADLALLRSGQSVQRLRAYEHRLRLAMQFGLAACLAAVVAILATLFAKRQERIATESFQRSEQLRNRAEKAEIEANERLYSALVARAAAERRTGLGAARENALTAVRQAAQLHPPTAELRSEAIAALALAEFPVRRRWKSYFPEGLPNYLSPDARLLATTLPGGIVEVRRISDDTRVATLNANSSNIESVGPFTADGRWLILALPDRCEVWDAERGTLREKLDPFWKRGFAVPGTSKIMSISNSVLYTFDPATGERQESGLSRSMDIFSPGPKGSVVAMANRNESSVRLWDFEAEEEIGDIRLPTGSRPWVMAFSPDGSKLGVGMNDRSVGIWATNDTNGPVQIFKGHGAEVNTVAWAPDGDLLITGSWDNTTRFWSLSEGRELARTVDSPMRPQFTPDGKQVSLVNFRTGDTLLSDVHYHENCRLLVEPGPPTQKSPNRVAFTPDSRWLITCSHDGLRAFDVRDGREVAHLQGATAQEIVIFPAPASRFVAITLNGRMVGGWETGEDGAFRFLPLRRVERAEIPELHPTKQPWVGNFRSTLCMFGADRSTNDLPNSSGVLTTEITENGEYVAATFGDHHAAYWKTGAKPEYHDLGPSRGYGISFSPNGRWLYHATDRELWQTSVETGKPGWHIPCETETWNADIKASRDGQFVAAALDPYKVMLVDAATGRKIAFFEHPSTQMINTIALSPDGAWLAVGCTSHVTQLWDLRRLHTELAAMKLDW
jgi:WD40 repeat protein